jgi:methanesulfonate monooxygenase large subunit
VPSSPKGSRRVERERRSVFERSWLLACHESEIANPGDARAIRHVARRSIIVLRGADGEIRCRDAGPGSCPMRTAIDFGQFVWVNFDDAAPALRDYVAGALDGMIATLASAELEVFACVTTPFDAGRSARPDRNGDVERGAVRRIEPAPDLLHPAYFVARDRAFANGHIAFAERVVRYEAYPGAAARTLTLGGLMPDHAREIAVFPGVAFRLRGSSLRVDAVRPISPQRVVVESRGLAPRSDTPKERAQRVREYDAIWGPFGCAREHGAGAGDFARRHFEVEWERRLGRPVSDPAIEALAG